VNPRDFSHRHLPGLVAGLDAVNRRHPWSHNDHFHRWALRHLPPRRRTALDVGCGHGRLLATLGNHFERVHGTDRDATMREVASRRVAHLPHASVGGQQLAELDGGYDLITMVAVLHHLETGPAMREVKRLLAPGGRLLVVGLARPESTLDWAWDTASLLTNPVIGLVKHPRPTGIDGGDEEPAYPVVEPQATYAELRRAFDARLPGTRMRRHLGFRYTASWTKPV